MDNDQNNDLRELEQQMGNLSPMAMPDDLLARMEQAMDRWQEHLPLEEKLVAFPPVSNGAGKMKYFNVWASAAAVALVGVVSLVMINGGGEKAQSVAAGNDLPVQPVAAIAAPAAKIPGVVQASYPQLDTSIRSTSDDVMSYDAQGRPVRLMRVDFEDVVTVRDAAGRLIKIKQPRIEYYVIPVEVH